MRLRVSGLRRFDADRDALQPGDAEPEYVEVRAFHHDVSGENITTDEERSFASVFMDLMREPEVVAIVVTDYSDTSIDREQ